MKQCAPHITAERIKLYLQCTHKIWFSYCVYCNATGRTICVISSMHNGIKFSHAMQFNSINSFLYTFNETMHNLICYSSLHIGLSYIVVNMCVISSVHKESLISYIHLTFHCSFFTKQLQLIHSNATTPVISLMHNGSDS